MRFEAFIAHRHLRAIRSRRRVVVTSLIAIAGVGLGVAALVITLSVMNGYAGMIWDRQVSMNPHITVRKPYSERIDDYGLLVSMLSAHPDVTGVGPYIESEGYVLGRNEAAGAVTSGVMVRGVDPDRVLETSGIADHLKVGEMVLSVQDADSLSGFKQAFRSAA